jgi:hypothetical protein
VCLPDVPAPMSASLEKAYYIGKAEIVAAVERLVAPKEKEWPTKSRSLTQESTIEA